MPITVIDETVGVGVVGAEDAAGLEDVPPLHAHSNTAVPRTNTAAQTNRFAILVMFELKMSRVLWPPSGICSSEFLSRNCSVARRCCRRSTDTHQSSFGKRNRGRLDSSGGGISRCLNSEQETRVGDTHPQKGCWR